MFHAANLTHDRPVLLDALHQVGFLANPLQRTVPSTLCLIAPLRGNARMGLADAGQLGAALLVSEQFADPLVFLCLDQRLVEAAEREGLAVADICD